VYCRAGNPLQVSVTCLDTALLLSERPEIVGGDVQVPFFLLLQPPSRLRADIIPLAPNRVPSTVRLTIVPVTGPLGIEKQGPQLLSSVANSDERARSGIES
jgi:hypothetical protein